MTGCDEKQNDFRNQKEKKKDKERGPNMLARMRKRNKRREDLAVIADNR